jgi:hypothetical protein
MLTVAPKPTPVAQADFGRNLKPALAAKLLVFSDFFRFGFPESAFHFLHLKFTPRGTKSTSVFKSHLKVRYTRQSKVDFGFQVAYQSPLHAAS